MMKNPESPMWSHQTESIENGRGQKITLMRGGQPVPYSVVIKLWQADADFRAYFTGLLAAAPHCAFRWETSSITVGVRSLLRESNGRKFRARVRQSRARRGSGGTAPTGTGGRLRTSRRFPAPCSEHTNDELWRQVGLEMQRRLTQPGPTSLSTAGGGVAWLHVRLDTRPKYYRYTPYRAIE
jgi:hypothetical protein